MDAILEVFRVWIAVNEGEGFIVDIPIIFILSVDIAERCVEKLAYTKQP